MQKFRDYIYCDHNKIKLYIGQIKEFQELETGNSYERDTVVNGELDVKLVKVGTELNETKTTNYITNINDLERIISWCLKDNNAVYFDCNTKLDNSDKDKMIFIEGKMTMPEMAENIELLYSLMGNGDLFATLPLEQTDENLKTLSLIKESDTIPIILETGSEYLITCLIRRELLDNVSDFLDNLDGTITIIGKIDRVYNDNDKIEIYDMAKEILKLNRTMRRSMKEEDLKSMVLNENGPLIKITPIIVYK